MSQRYKLSCGFEWEALVEIDDEASTEETIKHGVEFWSCAEELLRRHRGDYRMAFLDLLGQVMVRLSAQCDNVQDYLVEFTEKEGWPPLGGENGIKLIDVDPFAFDEISVRKMPA